MFSIDPLRMGVVAIRQKSRRGINCDPAFSHSSCSPSVVQNIGDVRNAQLSLQASTARKSYIHVVS